MSSTNKTTNYELTQFLATDVPSWLVDYNGDMSKIDTQMKVNATAAAAAQSKADGADSKADTNASDIDTLEAALNTPSTGLVARVSDAEGDIDTMQALIGNGTPTAGDQTIIGAENANTTAIGDLTQLDTTEKSNLVGAINEVISNTLIKNKSAIYNFFKNKKILILGDSNSLENVDWRGRTWVSDFRAILDGTGATITNNSVSGRRIAKSAGYTDSLVDTVDGLSQGDWDYVIVFCGVNDWNEQSQMGDMNTYQNYDFTKFCDSLKYCTGELFRKAPKAGIFFVTPLICNYINPTIPLLVYANALKGNTWAREGRSVCIIDGFCAPNYIVNGSNATEYSMDGLHPNAAYAPILANYIIESMINGGSPICKTNVTKDLTVNPSVGTGNARYTVESDGSVEVYMNVTLGSNAQYAPFISNGIPEFIWSNFDPGLWLARVNNNTATPAIHSVEYLDSANNSPYPSNDMLAEGTIYEVNQRLKPVSMNRTMY